MSKRRRRSLFSDRSRRGTKPPAPERDAGASASASEKEPTGDLEHAPTVLDEPDDPPEEAPVSAEPPAEAPTFEDPTAREHVADGRFDEVPTELASNPSFDDAIEGQFVPGFDGDFADEEATVRYPKMDDDAPPARLDDGEGFGDMGNFDDAPPPTDEVPSAVLQDVSQPYTAPMHVPEPPPIPGILDRFTPAGAQQRQSGPRKDQRPSYIADTPTPPPMLDRKEDSAFASLKKPIQRSDDGGGSPLPLIMAFVGVAGVGMLLMAIAAYALGLTGGGDTSGQVDNPTEELEGRGGIKVKVQEGLVPDPEPEVDPDPEPEVDPDPEPEVDPEPDVEPTAAPDPAPVRPRPRPRPDPEPEPEPVEEATSALGTLRIRSNRKVLIYVDGKAVGYTPKSYKADPGSRTISAMLPGQPQSKKTLTIDLKSGATTPVEFTF